MIMNRTASSTLIALAMVVGTVHAQEFPKPGPEHEKLKQLAGDWEGKAQCHFLPDQKEAPAQYKATVEIGGYFLVTEFKGSFGGQPFQGRGMTGYDPHKKTYVGTWVDSMSPSIYSIEGKFDESGKVFEEHMEGPDPTGKPMKMRMTTEVADADHMTFKMYGTPPGGDKEMLMLEVAYTRKK